MSYSVLLSLTRMDSPWITLHLCLMKSLYNHWHLMAALDSPRNQTAKNPAASMYMCPTPCMVKKVFIERGNDDDEPSCPLWRTPVYQREKAEPMDCTSTKTCGPHVSWCDPGPREMTQCEHPDIHVHVIVPPPVIQWKSLYYAYSRMIIIIIY